MLLTCTVFLLRPHKQVVGHFMESTFLLHKMADRVSVQPKRETSLTCKKIPKD